MAFAYVRTFDDAVDHQFDRLRGKPAADRFFYGLTEAANHSLLWHFISAVQSLSPSHRRHSLVMSASLMVESVLVNGPIKMAFRRDRPIAAEERPHKLRQPKTSSFPSGHATSAFCAGVLLSDAHPKARPFIFGLSALVASSRVYVRIHHASDIVAGAGIGVALGLLAKRAGSAILR